MAQCKFNTLFEFRTNERRFAGSDSTASTMQSFFHCILNAPEVYTSLQREIDEAQQRGGLSSIIQYAEAQKLEYFQACLKETMRIRPAVGLGIYRTVPSEGAIIDGQYFPGGTEVAVNGWVLHRDTGIFGDDSEVFRPDRWFKSDARAMNTHMYQVRPTHKIDKFTDKISSEVAVIYALVAIWRSSR